MSGLLNGAVAGVRLWGRFKCGACGRGFTADPDKVPVFTNVLGRWPMCLTCWDTRNKLRVAIGEPEQGRPPAYPEDYQEGPPS